ncbi:MAG: gamma-glutamylcyclotransferase [Hyphomicrobiaceae bacterium]
MCTAAADDLWIFGYGSLMWRPGFAFVERSSARLDGFHRAFCISSTHHRGTHARPGLVLGLDRGQSCHGVVYRVTAVEKHAVISYLRARELISGVYREMRLPVTLLDGSHREVSALTYVVERCHPSYVGVLPLTVQAHQIRGAQGISGANLDYLVNTVAHLRRSSVRERDLERLVAIAGHHALHFMRENLTSPASEGIRRAVCHQPDPARRMRPDARRRFLYRLKLTGTAGNTPPPC